MSYTPLYKRIYEQWKDRPYKVSGVSAKVMQQIDDTIIEVEDYLSNNDIHSVNANPEIEEDAPALSSMEIDGVNYKLAGGSSIDYSTEEQDTGIKWIDGKKIYQRTFVFNDVPPNSTTNHADSINDINEMISLDGVAYSSQFEQFYNIPNVHTSLNAYYINGLLSKSNNVYKPQIRTGNDFTQNIAKVYLTIKYTKVED